MTEERLSSLGALCQQATEGPWVDDDEGGVSVLYGELLGGMMTRNDAEFVAESRTALPEALAEVRRLRECLEFLADETKLSAEHHNSHLWAYIVGEALQVDPKESPFWEPDDEVSP